MTKQVRIENADTSTVGITVQTWEVGKGDEPDIMICEQDLLHPTSLLTLCIHSTRYLIVKEREKVEG